MKTDYYFLVKNNLAQEAKHREKMGDAVWQYLFYLSYANCANGKMKFYAETYAKRQKLDLEIVLERQNLLDKTGYILFKEIEKNVFEIRISKPINICINNN